MRVYKNLPPKDEVIAAISKSETIRDVGLNLGFKPGGAMNVRVKYLAELYGLKLPKFDYKVAAQRLATWNRIPDEEWFSRGTMRSGAETRKKLLRLGVPNACSNPQCPLNSGLVWLEKPVTPHVDHINGDRFDNRMENLRLLCPNCHQQTETWGNTRRIEKSGEKVTCVDCDVQISVGCLRCVTCNTKHRIATQRGSRIDWPEDNELLALVAENGYQGTGKILGVSDNAVKKRLRRQNLL